MGRELVIYCDESDSKGRYFSNFYGGLLVPAEHRDRLSQRLESLKGDLGLRAEIKWNSITPSIGPRYREILTALFDELSAGYAKIRIMFTQNRNQPILSEEQRGRGYHALYYQFIKHAFGLEHAGDGRSSTRVRLLLDRMPTTAEQTAVFRGHVLSLSQRPAFRRSRVEFLGDHIGEIDSRDHILAQCLDVVLGSMSFRLNNKHKEKPEGERARGRRTIEKERVYKHIHSLIRGLPNASVHFNIGISTGTPNGTMDRWTQAYRHWLFVPKDHVRDNSKTKKWGTP